MFILVTACLLQILVQFAMLLHTNLVLVRDVYCAHTLRLDRSAFTHKVVVLFTLFFHDILVLVHARCRVPPCVWKGVI